MKTSITTLVGSFALLGCASTFAASTVDIAVKGLIVPSACTPALSGGGVIDHGKISAKDLRPDNPSSLGPRTLRLSVDCDAPTLIALHSIDNRAASALMSGVYGLGFINGNQKLGWYYMYLENMMAEGVALQTIASGDQGITWYSEKSWEPRLYMSAASMADDSQPVPVQNLQADLTVYASIARTDGLDLSNEVTIDGSATLEVKYL
ncbi:hypothetical protein AO262_30390 [Pseudomonas fluorescens ABAC62]|nr:hypothetical protein AO262_30390 [Pseudomonas fluorescens ABAC62]